MSLSPVEPQAEPSHVASPAPHNPAPRLAQDPHFIPAQQRPLSTPVRCACACATAVLWWLAGQRWGFFALGWIALTPLLWSLHGLDTRARLRFGWGAGWLCFALINWWIAPTIARGGVMIGVSPSVGMLLGLLAVALIAAIHGSMVALSACVWNLNGRLAARTPWLLPLLFALLWAALDALRSHTPLAHSWGALAYTQWRDLALLQTASVVGQHGLTFLCVWFAASLALWMRRGDRVLWSAPVLLFLALHGWGAWTMREVPVATNGTQRRLRVLVVQTNVPSLRKNQPGFEHEPFREAYALTRQSPPGQYDVVVWPETTVDLAGSATGQLGALLKLSRELRATLLIGARTFDPQSGGYFNEAVLVRPDGTLAHSAKSRLVPFGERAPFGEYLPLLRRFAPRPEVSPAQKVAALQLDTSTRIGAIICFESCFPQPAAVLRAQGAQALFILTNDEWFRGTNAPWEHAAMATLRAVENRLPVVQAANGGYSFAVDPHGQFVVKSAFSAAQAVAVDIALK